MVTRDFRTLASNGHAGSGDGLDWWRTAAVYAVYPASFADANGDGFGDLQGLRDHLPYVAGLGFEAIWLCPWNQSPMVDGGYDVSDYRDINPLFGTLSDAKAVIDDAHRLGVRVIVDLVANHTSDQHPWFTAARSAAPGSADRDRYVFRDGRGPDGSLPPNNWISAFGDSAWSRLEDGEGAPGQWYLHTFAPEQPDLNWDDEEVVTEFEDIIRFWFDFGVDGLRIDAAPAMVKTPGLPDFDYAAYGEPATFASSRWTDSPHWDTAGVHTVLRRFRRIADEYEGRMFVAEAVVANAERLADYVRPDELHTAFNFPFLHAPWSPELRTIIDDTVEAHARVGAPATWCLSSHDEIRLATRLGRENTSAIHLVDPAHAPSDLALGRRRARAALMLMLALPGSAYIYQGEELGLPFVTDIPDERLRDPVFARSGGTTRGRDGCRVPMPWSGDEPPFGFSAEDVDPWLPMPADWADLTVEAQAARPDSTLALVRDALRIRHAFSAEPGLRWQPSPPDVLDFRRGANHRCIVNLSPDPIALDQNARVVLSSAPLESALMPPDTAVWLITP